MKRKKEKKKAENRMVSGECYLKEVKQAFHTYKNDVLWNAFLLNPF